MTKTRQRVPAPKSEPGSVRDDEALTAGDRLALFTGDILGNISFLVGLMVVLAFYMAWNVGLIPGLKTFDPVPFNILDSILSVFAIILTITILIAQVRQRRLEKVREQVEFEVNLRAENEITKILELLCEIQDHLGIQHKGEDLHQMKEKLNLTDLKEEVREKLKNE